MSVNLAAEIESVGLTAPIEAQATMATYLMFLKRRMGISGKSRPQYASQNPKPTSVARPITSVHNT